MEQIVVPTKRKRNHSRQPVKNEALVRDYLNGLSMVELSEKYNLSTQHVRLCIGKCDWLLEREEPLCDEILADFHEISDHRLRAWWLKLDHSISDTYL